MFGSTQQTIDIEELLAGKYGIAAETVKPLVGYECSNFEIVSEGTKYVLKIYPKDLVTKELLKAEVFFLETASKNGIEGVSKPVIDVGGKTVSTDSEGRLIRLLSFVEGSFLDEAEQPASTYESLGEYLAKLHIATAEVVPDAIVARDLDWNLLDYKLNTKYLPFIDNPRDRSLIEYFFLQNETVLDPFVEGLRKCVIHGDAHGSNVLAANGKVTGLIDFGDISYSALICDVAIAAAYALIETSAPFENAAAIVRGYQRVSPLSEAEIGLLHTLIVTRLCLTACHAAEAKTRRPDDEYVTISEKPAWEMLRELVHTNPIATEDLFRNAAGFESKLIDSRLSDLKRRQKHTSKALSITFSEPLKMESAAFQYMFDSLGNSYLDCYNNIPQVGHCHPGVVRAGQRAMARLNTNTRYLNDAYNEYAENLLAKFPESLNKVFFVNSGSAASDLAIRLAMSHTGNAGVLVMEHGYHGNTRLGIDISHYKYNRSGGAGRKERIAEAPIPDMYRRSESVEELADLANERIQDIDIAAFIAEPIVGCGGQVPLPEGYLARIYPAVRERGGICISDEVQTGFGRLGKHFWGFEMHDVEPDIVILGKPIGNGHPMAAVVTTDEIAGSFETGMEFFSSFGGNTVSCAIGQAVLDVLEDESLPENAETVGNYLLSRLKELVEKFESAGDARGVGLFLGLELVTDKESKTPNTELASKVREELKGKGILVGTDGPDVNVIKIKPPICFTKENADQLADAIEEVLSDIQD